MKDKKLGFQISLFSAAKKLTRVLQLYILSQIHLTICMDANMKIRDTIRASLIKHYLIPDVLAVAPGNYTTVMYSTFAVNMGNKVDPRYAQHTPSVWWPTEKGKLYTLLMVDADVPSRRNSQYRSRQHWLVVNIPGVDIYNGKTLTEYIGPIAPKNSGLHRNVFIVFKQPGTLTPDEPFISVINRGPNIRTKFSVRDFAAKYKLRDPVAVNFLQVGYPIYNNKDERHGWYRKGLTPPPHFTNNTGRPRFRDTLGRYDETQKNDFKTQETEVTTLDQIAD